MKHAECAMRTTVKTIRITTPQTLRWRWKKYARAIIYRQIYLFLCLDCICDFHFSLWPYLLAVRCFKSKRASKWKLLRIIFIFCAAILLSYVPFSFCFNNFHVNPLFNYPVWHWNGTKRNTFQTQSNGARASERKRERDICKLSRN